MSDRLVTRFAPAPTGRLHLGHVVNAIYVWGLARRLDASVLLRVEDHDGQRSRRSFEAALLDDLDWLGFVPDRYPTAAFRAGQCESRQSDRGAVYTAAANRLRAAGLVYGCTCTRQEIAAQQAAGADGTTRYPGTCRTRGLPLDDALTWRVRMEPGDETFVDLLKGSITQDAAAIHGDPAIRDRHGNWTYTFAVVVDDFEQDVNFVIRGDDLRGATAGQIRLGRMIGRARPARFAHHPVLMRSPTRKLSKADGDTGISDFRRNGWTAPQLIAHAAALAGLHASAAGIRADEVATLFRMVQLASD